MVDQKLVHELKRRKRKEGLQAVLDDFEKRGVPIEDMHEALAEIKAGKAHSGHSTRSIITWVFFAFVFSIVIGLVYTLLQQGASIMTTMLFSTFIVFGFVLIEGAILMVAADLITSSRMSYVTALKCKLFTYASFFIFLLFVMIFPETVTLIIVSILAVIIEIAIILLIFAFPLGTSILTYLLHNLFRASVYALFVIFGGFYILEKLIPLLNF
ncbi:MAG: hypothetical protein KJ709_03535 [Nanoarchaeota archaeon]|nr:hypothetical protein [Nanoarchaeota archaeon]